MKTTHLSFGKTYHKSVFDQIHENVFNHLILRKWGKASSLMEEARLFISGAFNAGSHQVAIHGLERLQELAYPIKDKAYRASKEYEGLWSTLEMKDFILSHLDCSPSQALDCAAAISPANAHTLVAGLSRRGLLEPTGARGEDIGPRYTGRYSVKLIQHLIENGYTDTATHLLRSLVVADDISDSDFFVDRELVKALISLISIDPQAKKMLIDIEPALVRLNGCEHNYGYGRHAPGFADVLALAEHGAVHIAKQLFIEGDYCSVRLDLSEIEGKFKSRFTLAQLRDIASNSMDFGGKKGVLFKNMEKYWAKTLLDNAAADLVNAEMRNLAEHEVKSVLKAMAKGVPSAIMIKIDRYREQRIGADLGL